MTPNKGRDVSWPRPARLPTGVGGAGLDPGICGPDLRWERLREPMRNFSPEMFCINISVHDCQEVRCCSYIFPAFLQTYWIIVIIQSQGEPTALYYTFLHQGLGLPLLRNSKQEMSLLFCLDLIYHKVWIWISRGTEIMGDGDELSFSYSIQH